MTTVFETNVDKVIGVLRDSGLDAMAFRVGNLLKAVTHNEMGVKRAALAEIAGLCSPKALGDTNVIGIEDAEWMNLLSNVRELATEEAEQSQS